MTRDYASGYRPLQYRRELKLIEVFISNHNIDVKRTIETVKRIIMYDYITVGLSYIMRKWKERLLRSIKIWIKHNILNKI